MTASRQGFSLIEATVAVAIVSLIGLSTAALLTRLPIESREARNQDIALRIGRNKLETLEAGGYTNLPTTTPSSFADSLLSSLASSSASVAVADVSSSTKRVDVSVFWLGIQGMRSTTLTTLMTKSSGLP